MVSRRTALSRLAASLRGLFVLHAKSLPCNPYDGHSLRDVIEDTQKLTGCEWSICRILACGRCGGWSCPALTSVMLSY